MISANGSRLRKKSDNIIGKTMIYRQYCRLEISTWNNMRVATEVYTISTIYQKISEIYQKISEIYKKILKIYRKISRIYQGYIDDTWTSDDFLSNG